MSISLCPKVYIFRLDKEGEVAFWQRKSNGRIFIYYWCRESGKQKVLPRIISEHLDLKTDEQVKEWVDQWDHFNDIKVGKRSPAIPSAFVKEITEFCQYQTEAFNRHPYTVQAHLHNLLDIALPYFESHANIKSLNDIKIHSTNLNKYLRDQLKYSPVMVKNIQMSLRMFWNWLEEERLVDGRLVLRKTFVPIQTTPLKILPEPKDILDWETQHDDLRLLLLITYFFSLRPQESFSLTKAAFLGGEA